MAVTLPDDVMTSASVICFVVVHRVLCIVGNQSLIVAAACLGKNSCSQNQLVGAIHIYYTCMIVFCLSKCGLGVFFSDEQQQQQPRYCTS
jgi:hypothetical protein